MTVLTAAGHMGALAISPADADSGRAGHQVIVDRAGTVTIDTTTVDGRAGESYTVDLAERPNRPPTAA